MGEPDPRPRSSPAASSGNAATFVRWDGKVSPCMGLLHAYKTYLYGNERKIEAYIVGDIAAGRSVEIWNSTEYRAFREKVRAFDFSPCHICGGCNHRRSEQGGLLRQHLPGLRRLPLGPGRHPVPVTTSCSFASITRPGPRWPRDSSTRSTRTGSRP